MTNGRAITDEDLVAYLDDELDTARRHQIDAALVHDARLRARLDALDIDTDAIRRAFDSMAADAPVATLRAGLDAAARRAVVARRRRTRLAVAAALVLGLALGYAVRFAGLDDRADDRRADDWRVAVADYQALYATATLASIASPAADQGADVAQVAAALGRPIALAALQLPGLDFKRAQILSFAGRPLAQFAYLDPAGVPVAVCAMRSGEPDSAIRTGTLRGLGAASWSRDGYGFIAIGKLPPDALARIAATVAPRL